MIKRAVPYPFFLTLCLVMSSAGCSPTANPEYGTSGFDAVGGVGQRLTDVLLEQANNHTLDPSIRMDQESPIQITPFINLDGSAAGSRFAHLMTEHMAQRLSARGYKITRALPAERVLQKAFPMDTDVTESPQE